MGHDSGEPNFFYALVRAVTDQSLTDFDVRLLAFFCDVSNAEGQSWYGAEKIARTLGRQTHERSECAPKG